MIYSDDTQSILRENNLIAENEIALQSGDLILAENVLTKERRMLQKIELQGNEFYLVLENYVLGRITNET